MLSLLTNLPVFPYADAAVYNYKSAATILGVSGGRHFTCSSVMESGGVYPLPVRGHTLSYDALAETFGGVTERNNVIVPKQNQGLKRQS